MAAEIIKPGDKIHIVTFNQSMNDKPEETASELYESQLFEVLDDGQINIAMPIQKGKTVLFAEGQKFGALFYGKGKRHKAALQVTARGKEGGISFLTCQFLTQAKNAQRRAYYRLPKTVTVEYYIWDGYEEGMTEQEALKACQQYSPDTIMRGISIDISGGGMKMLLNEPLEKGQYVMLGFGLAIDGQSESFKLMGHVIESLRVPDADSKYITRLQFIGIKSGTQEKIIKYIFNEERKHIRGEG